MVFLRIAILFTLVCVTTREIPPSFSLHVFDSAFDLFAGSDEHDQAPLEETDADSELPADVEEEKEVELKKAEELTGDHRSGRQDLTSGHVTYCVEFAPLPASFDESFVTFQPLRV